LTWSRAKPLAPKEFAFSILALQAEGSTFKSWRARHFLKVANSDATTFSPAISEE